MVLFYFITLKLSPQQMLMIITGHVSKLMHMMQQKCRVLLSQEHLQLIWLQRLNKQQQLLRHQITVHRLGLHQTLFQFHWQLLCLLPGQTDPVIVTKTSEMELWDAGVNITGLKLPTTSGLPGNGRLQLERTSNQESDTNPANQSTRQSTSIPTSAPPRKDGARKSHWSMQAQHSLLSLLSL